MPRAVGHGIGAGFVGAGGRVGRATPPGRKRSRTGTRRLPGIACALPAEHERTWLCSRPWRPASVTTNAGRADRPRRLPVGRLRPIPLSANAIVGLRPRFVDQECWRALPASASCHEAGPEDSPRQSPHYLHEAELRQVDTDVLRVRRLWAGTSASFEASNARWTARGCRWCASLAPLRNRSSAQGSVRRLSNQNVRTE
jgi:hypothetical protein